MVDNTFNIGDFSFTSSGRFVGRTYESTILNVKSISSTDTSGNNSIIRFHTINVGSLGGTSDLIDTTKGAIKIGIAGATSIERVDNVIVHGNVIGSGAKYNFVINALNIVVNGKVTDTKLGNFGGSMGGTISRSFTANGLIGSTLYTMDCPYSTGSKAYYGVSQGTTENFVLNGSGDYKASGSFSYDFYGSDTNRNFISLSMNGTGTQALTSTRLMFNKGISVSSGKLTVNFAQDAAAYKSYFEYSKTIDSVVYNVENTYTYVNNKTDNAATTDSHGDLIITGGTFGADLSGLEYGAFRFTNIKYTDGTISLSLDSATEMYTLDLTSYVRLTSERTKLTTDNYAGEAIYNAALDKVIAGGSVTKQGDKAITFDFGGNLAWLLEATEGVRVIAWDSFASATGLTAEDFAANDFYDNGILKAKAEFTLASDGLYVKYVAVPEASTFAALLGFLAISFAFIRRRLK